jgi:hypothetical protein
MQIGANCYSVGRYTERVEGSVSQEIDHPPAPVLAVY